MQGGIWVTFYGCYLDIVHDFYYLLAGIAV